MRYIIKIIILTMLSLLLASCQLVQESDDKPSGESNEQTPTIMPLIGIQIVEYHENRVINAELGSEIISDYRDGVGYDTINGDNIITTIVHVNTVDKKETNTTIDFEYLVDIDYITHVAIKPIFKDQNGNRIYGDEIRYDTNTTHVIHYEGESYDRNEKVGKLEFNITLVDIDLLNAITLLEYDASHTIINQQELALDGERDQFIASDETAYFKVIVKTINESGDRIEKYHVYTRDEIEADHDHKIYDTYFGVNENHEYIIHSIDFTLE